VFIEDPRVERLPAGEALDAAAVERLPVGRHHLHVHNSRCYKSGTRNFRRPQNPFITRVAGWDIFKSKIPIWVHFVLFFDARCWYILWPFGIFYGNLVHFFPFL
jgi:hypothetical protein